MDRRLRGFKTGSWIYPNLLNEKGAVFFSWTSWDCFAFNFSCRVFPSVFSELQIFKERKNEAFFWRDSETGISRGKTSKDEMVLAFCSNRFLSQPQFRAGMKNSRFPSK